MKGIDEIFIPTYNRKKPLILALLNHDKFIHLNFMVRSEADDEKFYDEFKSNPQISIIRLGYGLKDVGDTRQAILEYCYDHGYDFCPMFDDTVSNLSILKKNISCIDILYECASMMLADDLLDVTAGFSFIKRYGQFADGRIVDVMDKRKCYDYRYLSVFPCQAIMLNLKVLHKYNIQYRPFKQFGFEDTNFFIDCLKKGLVFIDRPSYVFDAAVPNEKKTGGTHSIDESINKKSTELSLLSMQYIGHIFGVHVEKRYHSFANDSATYLDPDLEYFRKVLVYNREKNADIIKNEFNIEKCLLNTTKS